VETGNGNLERGWQPLLVTTDYRLPEQRLEL